MFGQDWNYIGPFFLLALVLALWSVFNIAQSRSGPLAKALWIVFVLFIPFIGFICWLLFGPRSSR